MDRIAQFEKRELNYILTLGITCLTFLKIWKTSQWGFCQFLAQLTFANEFFQAWTLQKK